MMSNYVTIRGFVGTEIKCAVAGSGLPIAKFRLGSSDRYFDKKTNAWVDGDTNWYSVSMFRQLATNAGVSLQKGDRIIVTGKLRVRTWITDEGKSGTTVEIDADSAGHDLVFGTASFRRSSADRNDSAVQEGADEGFDGVNYATGEISTPGYGAPGTAVEESPEPSDDPAETEVGGDRELASAPF
ncbi:single-stranded DNA-binding protein [Arthrobacter parietis]|uniref:Single-stranded DNA-binding protein n=2 Tax=Arthrobacter TaxID=1663 RepID=A0ABT6CRK3_9MICC|nr:single-stranded DNA-binding protein [Arthrobacter vasquezii]MDF9276613.1 single-stranded DNA-binding protein [Arthrobacter vasquezii]